MSALGQKRTLRRKKRCPLYPRKRTFAVHWRMSALGQKVDMADVIFPCADHSATSASHLYVPVRANALRSTSKITAVDHPISNTPFNAVIGPSRRQRSTGTMSP